MDSATTFAVKLFAEIDWSDNHADSFVRFYNTKIASIVGIFNRHPKMVGGDWLLVNSGNSIIRFLSFGFWQQRTHLFGV